MLGKLTLLTLLALFALTPAWADGGGYRQPRRYYEERRERRDDRRVWTYDVNRGGSFEQQRGRRWLELRRNGPPIAFIEVDRTEDYVELYDEGRDLYVRLHDDVYYSREGGRRHWQIVAEGRWE
jgi:hypothetical protein